MTLTGFRAGCAAMVSSSASFAAMASSNTLEWPPSATAAANLWSSLFSLALHAAWRCSSAGRALCAAASWRRNSSITNSTTSGRNTSA
jgi:hypothetical protein